jgi:hypothetical protein
MARRLPFLACSGAAAPLLDYRELRRQRQQAQLEAVAVPCPLFPACAQQQQPATVQDLLVEGLLQFEPLQEPSLRSLRLCNKHTHAVLSKVVAAPTARSAAEQQPSQIDDGSRAVALLQRAAYEACSRAAAALLVQAWPSPLEAHVLEHGQVGALLMMIVGGGSNALKPGLSACPHLPCLVTSAAAAAGQPNSSHISQPAARDQQQPSSHPHGERQRLHSPVCAQGWLHAVVCA